MADEKLVKAVGLDLPISPKHAIELCTYIKGKELVKVKAKLNLVIEEKFVMPLSRFDRKRGHKAGHLGPGFYPKKASKHFLNLIKTLEGNAKNQGLNLENLYIQNAMANRAPISWHYSRHRGRRMKRTHVTLFAKQRETKKQQGKKK